MQKKKYLHLIIIGIIIFLGLFLRFRLYLRGDALSLDEIFLCLNFTGTNFNEMFLQPNNHQVCSPLFMVLYWLLYKIAGGNEFILRFSPLFFGCVSLFFFYFLLKKFFNSKLAITSGLFLFSILPPLLMYSKEIKEYSSDMLFTIILLLFYDKINLSSKRDIVLYTFGAIIVSLFSYTAIPIIAIIILLKILQNGSLKEKLNYIYPFSAVLLSGLYVLIRSFSTKDFMYKFWAGKFLPFWDLLTDCFKYFEFDERFINFMICFFIFGFVLTLLKWKKNILPILIFLFAISASLLKIYPMAERLLLYLIPIFIIFLMYPLENINNKYLNITKNTVILIILFFFINIPQLLCNVFNKNFDIMDSPYERTLKKNASEFFLNKITPYTNIYCSYFMYSYIKYYDLVSSHNKLKNINYIYNWNIDENLIKNCWLIGFKDNPNRTTAGISEKYNGGIYSINSRNMFKHNLEQILYFAQMKKMKCEEYVIDGGNKVDYIVMVHIFKEKNNS